jgi:acyl-CoA reductase-like NAD-dependent aldehyde dehydrogenase
LATHPDDEFRNGDEAVALAKRALRLAKSNPAAKAKILDTLAAAYAEQKEFPAAIYTAQQASDLARQNHQEGFAERTAMKIRLYEHRTPYRENPVPPVPKMMYFP